MMHVPSVDAVTHCYVKTKVIPSLKGRQKTLTSKSSLLILMQEMAPNKGKIDNYCTNLCIFCQKWLGEKSSFL